MFSQQVDYYAEEPVLSALNAAYSAIFAELQTETTMNFSNNIKVHNASEHAEDTEYEDSDIFVEIAQLQEIVQVWFDESGLTESVFQAGFSGLDNINESDKICYVITLTKDSDTEILFNILYARSITLETIELEHTSEQQIQYEDYDYSDFIGNASDALVNNTDLAEYVFEFDHVGGDSGDNKIYVDLYFKINPKDE
jgi:hypothetical protein